MSSSLTPAHHRQLEQRAVLGAQFLERDLD